MTEVPEFVRIVRHHVPKDGLTTDHPSRVKSRIRKALIKAGYTLETIRGVGQKLDDYALVYEDDGKILKANFQPYNSLDLKPRSSRKKSKKGKSPLITGPHPTVAHLSQEEFAQSIIDNFPNSWQKQDSRVYRWLAIDIGLLLKTQYTVESAVDHFIDLSQTALPHAETINFTTVEVQGNYLIGIGPA